jgi:heme oxygenase
MSLRDLTKHYHQEAERQEFVSVLMSGKINPNLYATYLWNQYFRYDALEKIATTHGLLRGYYDGICRDQI